MATAAQDGQDEGPGDAPCSRTMATSDVTIASAVGLHARPAALFEASPGLSVVQPIGPRGVPLRGRHKHCLGV